MRLHHNGSSRLARLHAATEQIAETSQEVKDQAMEYTEDLVKYVKKNPIRSVIVAAGLGVLLGMFIL